jgi:CRP-like cAMP-binding protein
MSDEVIADLQAIGILSYMTPDNLEALKFHGVFGEYGVGETIMEQDSQQHNLYFVISGRMEVFLTKAGAQVKLGEVGPGDCLGELSVFEPGLASATVKVVETAVLWSLDIRALQQFFMNAPAGGGQLMLGICQLLSKRLRAANNQILQMQVIPSHLSVRCGKIKGPIKADSPDEEDDKSSLLGGLFGGGKKSEKPKISTTIKK